MEYTLKIAITDVKVPLVLAIGLGTNRPPRRCTSGIDEIRLRGILGISAIRDKP